ncbi:DUF3850 domain-containing protein [Weissella muntiaci]|uniref:DUF3850 domain-containing protein n=1 Tax=Weissella muntiaci TaxID=2508881 RepID=A0A6C2CAD3_9LACO|nr:DUF3850 domain-containing protein [Weissella muntiaci]
MKNIHDLKIEHIFFQDVRNGIKDFEIRYNDRGFRVGDILRLHEWIDGEYTGNQVSKIVKYISSYEQKTGFVVLGLMDILEAE